MFPILFPLFAPLKWAITGRACFWGEAVLGLGNTTHRSHSNSDLNGLLYAEAMTLPTIWVFGDQLNRSIGALASATPLTHRVLFIESAAKISSQKWHIQRAHFIVASMRKFANELQTEGFEVDYRCSGSMREGFDSHVLEFHPAEVVATEPNSYGARQLAERLGVRTVPSNQFLCHPSEYQGFLGTRKSIKMEDFYRWQRKRLNVLMDSDEPTGGRWNFDEENRQPPPKTGHDRWPVPALYELDEVDEQVLAAVQSHCFGKLPVGQWATTRDSALERLQFFIEQVLPVFGEHEDAMLKSNWHLAHSLLSPYLNNCLLLPGEVVEAAQSAFREGKVPLNSAEGFVRQIIGWREYIWNCYWQWMPDYAHMNALSADVDLPPMFTNPSKTSMGCMKSVLSGVDERSYSHHIERLMVLGNFALIAGINPQQLTRWMWNSYIDAAEWVMVPNVIGMSQYADGGMLATKPYASGGAYIDRMSDHCKGCVYDRKKRTGDDACPFTVLYWDFFLRHQDRFVKNPRVARQVRAAQQLQDRDELQVVAVSMMKKLNAGTL
jgi:deoxyribodipyrimidine photolyase-related protein